MSKTILPSEVSTIIFVCEAGVGSSLMSVNSLKKKFKQANITNVNVVHSATARLPHDAKLVVCHKGVTKSALLRAPEAVVIGFNMFFNDPVFDKIVKAFVDGTPLSDDM
jgi:mannitol-specific phosphotransferase system IIBC component